MAQRKTHNPFPSQAKKDAQIMLLSKVQPRTQPSRAALESAEEQTRKQMLEVGQHDKVSHRQHTEKKRFNAKNVPLL